ncbi:nuclear transport factor 2 family protein [bacterium]|nr:nuclear transport factor 2 family protein [bacterium]
MAGETVKSVAERLVKYCKEGKEAQGLKELYAPDAVSVEAMAPPGGKARTEGLAGIKGKHDWWNGAHTIHSTTVEGPFMHGRNRFGVIFSMDVTNKQSKERIQMKELAIYTVRQGKISKEEFFYG